MNRDYNYRKFKRYVKGMRRIRVDRAQHGRDHSCACFNLDGRTFSRFADYPQLCSSWCCGNQRKAFGPTIQEIKATYKEPV